jgi:hypothetical protein
MKEGNEVSTHAEEGTQHPRSGADYQEKSKKGANWLINSQIWVWLAGLPGDSPRKSPAPKTRPRLSLGSWMPICAIEIGVDSQKNHCPENYSRDCPPGCQDLGTLKGQG